VPATVFGIEVPDLDEDDGTPVEVLLVVKCLKPEPDTRAENACPYQIRIRRSAHLPTWEAHGMAAYVQAVAFDEDLYGDDETDGEVSAG
jgi:hypothetical protein